MKMLIFAITLFLLIKLFFFILLTNNKKILFLKNFAITNLSSITASVSMFFFIPWLKRMTGLRFSASRWSLFAALAVLIIVESIFYCKFEKEIKKYRIIIIVILVNLIAVGFSSPFAIHTGHRPSKRMFRASCRSNLKQIGLSLKQYAMDYDDYFPDKSGPLGFEKLRSTDYLTDYRVYSCPSCKVPRVEGNQKLNNKIVSYVYKSGLRDNDGSDQSKTPLAWDRPTNHENYGNVLFVDGHVKGFYGKDWMEQAGIKKSEIDVQKQYTMMKNAWKMKPSAAKRKKVLENCNLLEHEIRKSFYLDNNTDKLKLVNFLSQFKDKENTMIRLLKAQTHELLEQEIYNIDITEGWLYWLAFMMRQSVLDHKEETDLASAAYQVKKFSGWKRERLDKIVELIGNSKRKNIEAIGLSYEEFCGYLLKEIRKIKQGWYLKASKYPYGKNIKTKNILINKYVEFANASKGKAKYESYCNFNKALEASFLYEDRRELTTLIDFLTSVKQRETDIYSAALYSLRRRRSTINAAYIYWMVFLIKQLELTQSELGLGDDFGLKEALECTLQSTGASANDIDNIILYLNKHKAELTKGMAELKIDYVSLKKSLPPLRDKVAHYEGIPLKYGGSK